MCVQIAELEAEYESSVEEKKRLTNTIHQTETRLKRAAKLTTGLADEKDHWTMSVEVQEDEHIFYMNNTTSKIYVFFYFPGMLMDWNGGNSHLGANIVFV